MKADTIAAIATSVSDSGIGIIRISGVDAIAIADRLYKSKNGKKHISDVKSHTIHYGFIYDEDEFIDEVMVAVMKAPNTYTKEDIVEIDCHGGILVINRILELVLKSGCRLAEPGEFTKRAFLNGRIDLSKAEAVMDIIHAKNEFALKASVHQLRGAVSEKVRSLREDIIYEIAFIESALDDPEHISLEGYSEKLQEKSWSISQDLKKLIDSSNNGKIIKNGINTVIVGKPNAGKSSLLNLLVGEDKAIVTSIAGTTRDVLEESIKLHGIGLHVIDTAGIRDTQDEVEKIGVEKARKYANNADLIIYVVDSSRPLDKDDREIISLIRNKKVIVLLNKTDLAAVIEEEDIKKAFRSIYQEAGVSDKAEKENIFEDGSLNIVKVSARHNIGIEDLEKVIKSIFFQGEIAINDEIYITNQRHKEALVQAFESMQQVLKSLENNMPEDFYSIDLMSAYASLGYIIGEEVEDDLVNEIFSKFCMGK